MKGPRNDKLWNERIEHRPRHCQGMRLCKTRQMPENFTSLFFIRGVTVYQSEIRPRGSFLGNTRHRLT